MAVGRLLLPVVLIAVLAVVLPTVFPSFTQRLVFRTILTAQTLRHTLFPEPDAPADRSARARALQVMISSDAVQDQPSVQELRHLLDGFGTIVPVPLDGVVERVNISQAIHGFWISTGTYIVEEGEVDNSTVVLFLHGGGHVAGSIKSHAGFAAEVARRVKGRVLFLEYRMGPENPLPVATDDALQAYKWLLTTKRIDPKRVAFVGDSAGGGLVLLTLLALNDPKTALPLPGAAVTFSAFTDTAIKPTETRPSWKKNAGKDMIADAEYAALVASWATGTKLEDYDKRKSPKFSPIYANLESVKFPPLFMQAGGDEVLLDDTEHFVGKALQAHVDVTYKNYPYMIHVFQLYFDYLAEADAALTDAARFILEHTAIPPPPAKKANSQ